ncbi:hypothetical protein LTR86_008930 [Recurvomyces mirabilis]|nr:hypothetical protein LTR86_008930 [Recurvomyces mirabilis]
MGSTTTGSVDHTQALKPRELPPGAPGKPYVISSQDGEIIYIPLSKSATRLLVTGKESDNAFAIVASGGSQSDPIGFHYHQEAHDVFLCLAGEVNVWAGDQCRTMTAGDFASVPPGTIHQYQVLGPHSEFAGLIVPGGWEEFFRFIGEPYSGPMWPMQDDRNFFEVLLPRLKQAAEQFDMVPCPQHKHFEPQAWQISDHRLPGQPEPYFLKNATGPAYEVGGVVCRPLVTTAESYGKFAIGSIEASRQHQQSSMFADSGKSFCFDAVHHAFMVVQGAFKFQLESSTSSALSTEDVIYVPRGTRFRFEATSRFAKMYAFANGGGLVELLSQLGQKHDLPILSDSASQVDYEALARLQQSCGFVLS